MDAGARFQAAPDVCWRDVPGELLLFDARTDQYQVLNETAAELWRRLVAGAPIEEIAVGLSREFDADAAKILADITAAASDFHARGLLEQRP